MTIHDSIVTFPEHAEAVTAIMEDASGAAGVRPAIKVAPFDEEIQDARGGPRGERVA